MLKKRIISGTILAFGIAALFFFGGEPFSFGKYVLAATLLAVSVIGFFELTRALDGNQEMRKPKPMEVIGFAGIGVYYIVITFAKNPIFYFLTVIVFVLAELLCYVIRYPARNIKDLLNAVFSFFYVPVMLSFVYLTRSIDGYGKFMVWLILASSWGSDTLAFAFGKSFGKTKIFPHLSPNKSFQGCAGGVLGAAFLGWFFAFVIMNKICGIPGFEVPIPFICGIAAVTSMIGDLAASAIKRDKGIKDYGKVIPGHGGVMDRFDSMIMTAPIIYLLTFTLDFSRNLR